MSGTQWSMRGDHGCDVMAPVASACFLGDRVRKEPRMYIVLILRAGKSIGPNSSPTVSPETKKQYFLEHCLMSRWFSQMLRYAGARQKSYTKIHTVQNEGKEFNKCIIIVTDCTAALKIFSRYPGLSETNQCKCSPSILHQNICKKT